jgi:hypothetical protein
LLPLANTARRAAEGELIGKGLKKNENNKNQEEKLEEEEEMIKRGRGYCK